jgi:CDP-paratose 2-epimerase
MQVRDVLFIDDLVEALVTAHDQIDEISGQAFNIGGGAGNTTSLLELLERIQALTGGHTSVTQLGWRTGDQRYYVSDTRKFQDATGWRAKVGVDHGVTRLFEWLRDAEVARPSTRPTAERPALVVLEGNSNGGISPGSASTHARG